MIGLAWAGLSVQEMLTGQRLLPGSAYASCGNSKPTLLPAVVRVGLYEEFPVPWRLDKLKQVDFQVTLAIAATSRADYIKLRESILQTYPSVRETFFWPVLAPSEGYYPGSWSEADGLQRVAAEAEGLPVLWDLELPLETFNSSLENWWRNRTFLDSWLSQRTEPVHIWRSHTSMGLDPLFLRLIAMHFDPLDYPAVTLHLNLYTTGSGLPSDELARILRCGVEKYGERFIPAFGSLNDGEGPEEIFVPPDTLRRDLQLAREAGVSEVWLFGVNGLNKDYLSAIRETLPLESLSK